METNENENTKSLGCSMSNFQRKVYGDTGLPPEARKISSKQPDLIPKGARRRTTTKPQISRRKKLIRIRAEINDTKTKNKNNRTINDLFRSLKR